MTGRLDQVDLDTDLILIVLARADDEGLAVNDLYSQIEAVDVDPFVFDEAFPDGFDEYIQGCRMLNKVGQIEPVHEKVRLTDAGELMAEHLESALDPEQGEALHHAGVVA